MKKISLLMLLLLMPLAGRTQDDLLAEIDKQDTVQFAEAAFKGLKIVNLESTKLASKKSLYFVVSHRFGSIKDGIREFFGLDQAVTRLHFIYGISDGWNIGFSRSSFQKTYDLNTKYRLVRQRDGGSPVTVVGFNGILLNGNLDEALVPDLEFIDRLGYISQILISRKFSERLSLELAPSFFYDNYLPDVAGDQDQMKAQFAMGVGGRLKLSKRLSLNVDYAAHLNRADNNPFNDPLSIGVDIETGGHVFQLHFTNAQPSFENGFLGQANGSWGDGVIFFGFNLSRNF
ncbi:MAG: DUF5777 family beta-barrel protein [Flavobacteriaceae bacterium]